jgi:hypothetical protein
MGNYLWPPKIDRFFSGMPGAVINRYSQGQLPDFYAPLKTSLVLSRGVGSPTFTRTTTACTSDFEGLLKPVKIGEARFTGARRVENRVPASNTNVGWLSAGAPTLSLDTVIFPPNATQSIKMVTTGASQGLYVSTLEVGKTYTTSLWLKGDVNGRQLVIQYGTTSGTLTITDTWKRYSFTGSCVSTANLRLYSPATPQTIYMSGIQYEDVTGQSNQNPSEYVSKGILSSPYHGCNVDGVKYFDYQNGNTVAATVVTEAQGVTISESILKGYLSEKQSTNLCLQSNALATAPWTQTNVNITADSIAGPDGTLTAETLTALASDATLVQTPTATTNIPKTFAIFLKRKTGTGSISMSLDGGSTYTEKTITSSWARYWITQTIAAHSLVIKISTSGDAIYATRAQLEEMQNPTTCMPTTTTAVTRNGDVLTYSVSNYLTSMGSAVATINMLTVTSATSRTVLDPISSYLMRIKDTGVLSIYDGTTTKDTVATIAAGSNKIGSTWGPSGLTPYLNGVAPASEAFDGTMNAGATLGIGVANTTLQLNGNVKEVKIWKKELSSAKMSLLTT